MAAAATSPGNVSDRPLSLYGSDPTVMVEALSRHREYCLGVLQASGFMAPSEMARMRGERNYYDAFVILCNRLLLPSNAHLRVLVWNMIQDNDGLKRAVFAQPGNATAPESPRSAAKYIPNPSVCIGRDGIIEELVTKLIGPRLSSQQVVIIQGVGGIGKSTIALKVLHNPSIMTTFEQRRFFVRCDNILSVNALETAMVQTVLPQAPPGDPRHVLQHFMENKSFIFVLDNFEDVVASEPDAMALGDFLEWLKTFAFVLITMRGKKSFSAADSYHHINSLNKSAARLAFLGFCKPHANLVEADPEFDTLLDELDGYPLVISLLARRVDDDVLPGNLLSQYREESEELIQHDDSQQRDASLQKSVVISLQSPVMQKADCALKLCYLLSILPDGADVMMTETLPFQRRQQFTRSQISNKAASARSALVQAGLASHNAGQRLYMLAPVRMYLQNTQHSIDELPIMVDIVFDHYGQRISDVMKMDESQRARKVLTLLVTDLQNINRSLLGALRQPDSAIFKKATILIGELAQLLSRTSHLRLECFGTAYNMLRNERRPFWAVNCIRQLGEFSSYSGDFDTAASLLEWSLSLVTIESNDLRQMGKCQFSCARFYRYSGLLEKANDLFQLALQNFEHVKDRRGQADVLRELSYMWLQVNDLDKASQLARQSLKLYKIDCDILGEARVLKHVANILIRGKNYEEAKIQLGHCLPLFIELGDRIGEANAQSDLGLVETFLRHYESATEHLKEALHIFQSVRSKDGERIAQDRINMAAELSLMTLNSTPKIQSNTFNRDKMTPLLENKRVDHVSNEGPSSSRPPRPTWDTRPTHTPPPPPQENRHYERSPDPFDHKTLLSTVGDTPITPRLRTSPVHRVLSRLTEGLVNTLPSQEAPLQPQQQQR